MSPDVVNPKYRCRACGWVHFPHVECDLNHLFRKAMKPLIEEWRKQHEDPED